MPPRRIQPGNLPLVRAPRVHPLNLFCHVLFSLNGASHSHYMCLVFRHYVSWKTRAQPKCKINNIFSRQLGLIVFLHLTFSYRVHPYTNPSTSRPFAINGVSGDCVRRNFVRNFWVRDLLVSVRLTFFSSKTLQIH